MGSSEKPHLVKAHGIERLMILAVAVTHNDLAVAALLQKWL